MPICVSRRTILKAGTAALATLGAAGCALDDDASVVPGHALTALRTDRAAYRPGEIVRVYALIDGARINAGAARLELRVGHLGAMVATVDRQVEVAGSRTFEVALDWEPPVRDFTGYSISARLFDAEGRLSGMRESAVDVSSDWRRFPRYGYLTDFGDRVDPDRVLDELSGFHVNALQFYDWQWKHHAPLNLQDGRLAPSWRELSGRAVYRSTLERLIEGVHRRGMVALQYNLIYGAADGWEDDGVDAAWALHEKPKGRLWTHGPFPDSWTSRRLTLFNPADPGWRAYILDRELDVFRFLAFDGWHADTVGDLGTKYTAQGKAVSLRQTFRPFLDEARRRLGSKYLVFNVVGARGHEEVDAGAIDAPYMEIWPGDGIATYHELKRIIDVTRRETGGKSLVVPAYMNYEFAKKRSIAAPGQFNAAGVLLTEATVQAAGGTRFELGDGSQMLSNEYFPSRALEMSSSLKAAMQAYCDFAVAFQNVLRDGQHDVANRIVLAGREASSDGRADTVWTFAKQDARREIVHFINLVGIRDIRWRDADATQGVPEAIDDLLVRYYTALPAGHATFASPDPGSGRCRPIPTTGGADADGPWLEFRLPSLKYWSLMILSSTG